MGKIGFIFLWVTLLLSKAPPIFAKESGIFIRTLPTSASKTYQFQNALARNLDSVFDDVPGTIKKDVVNKRLIQALVDIFKNYMNKENYLPSQGQIFGAQNPNCQLFTYCSMCSQSPQYFDQALDRVKLIQTRDPNTARVFKALNRFVGFASTSINLSVAKDYKPPMSFHDLVKRITLSGLQPYPHLEKDISYFQLILLNTIELLANLKVGKRSYAQIQKRVQKTLEQNSNVMLTEMMACPEIKKSGLATLPKAPSKIKVPKAKVKRKIEPSLENWKTPKTKPKEKSLKDLLQFMSEEEKENIPKKAR